MTATGQAPEAPIPPSTAADATSAPTPTPPAAPTAAPAKPRTNRVDGWDFARGVGVLTIMQLHVLDRAGHGILEGYGLTALAIFFTLSGYLITSILLGDVRKFGRVRVGMFYMNRVIRLLPALAVVLAAYCVAELVFDTNDTAILATIAVVLGYVANLPYLRDLTGELRQVWTLAFEEQFYLIWPALLAFAVRRKIAVQVTVGIIGLVTVAMLASIVVFWDDPTSIYTLPTSWGAPLLFGCLAAVHREKVFAWVKPGRREGLPLLVVALVGMFGVGYFLRSDQQMMYLGGITVVGASCAIVMLWLGTWREIDHPLLRPFVGMGVISYAAYLWHYPVIAYVHDVVPGTAAQIVLSTVLSIGVSVASWFWVEKPAQRWWRDRLRAKAAAQQASAVA